MSDSLLKISVVTVCYNSAETIEKTIQSVFKQDYPNLEYIIIDGASTDNTLSIVDKYKSNITRIISEKDLGMYDALNKGIKLAIGDIVGIMNADDEFANNDVLSKIAHRFEQDYHLDIVFGDVKFLGATGKTIRYYSSAKWNPERFARGFMPAHPTFYCKTRHFREIGLYSLDFEIAADYELLIRFLKIHKLKYAYMPLLMVVMRKGGKSTKGLRSNFVITREIMKACKLNGIHTNYLALYSKYFFKIFELGRNRQQNISSR